LRSRGSVAGAVHKRVTRQLKNLTLLFGSDGPHDLLLKGRHRTSEYPFAIACPCMLPQDIESDL
jgi:hypothetical protein